jgi:phosphoenolpyruvate carboxykinase (GTP)
VGVVPTKEELNLEGLEIDDAVLDQLLAIDVDRWKQEISLREAHLKAFDGLPERIWEAHRRVAQDLDQA